MAGRHFSASLAARARASALECERMSPAVPPDNANREPAPQLTIERVVMGDRRDPREQVLEAADEQAAGERMRLTGAYAGILTEPRPHVVNPLRDVRIGLAELQPPIVIELEMIVPVDQDRQYACAVQIDLANTSARSLVDDENGRSEPQRSHLSLVRADRGVNQADRAVEESHLLLVRVGPHPHALYALRATPFGLAAAKTPQAVGVFAPRGLQAAAL